MPVVAPPVPIPIPARPALEACPEDPGVQGVVKDGHVHIDVQEAIKLRVYIEGLRNCSRINVIILHGHIEKLENRLRAIQ